MVFTLPQRNLPPIVEQMAKGPVTVTAWSGEDNQELAEGTLLTPDNAIDMTTGTIRLKATFANQENRLWPGQFVEARLLLRTEQPGGRRADAGGAARSGQPLRLCREA